MVLPVYDEDGNQLTEEETDIKFDEYWKQIYHKHENKIFKVWNPQEK